ncbi:hypothetical protein GCM10027169_22560 [Gordonia jinhuaensis]|uniref:PemK-like, MazF-like toxin of type II toxin-antitoxin system n=1 Tax=Gordonia jinhuaensis TaxID=1517702 RepID=A0A916WZ31_9ACTN|nr:hypothetical protein GCM10011489_31010 [Gordonia jinhuaensis]
MSGIIEPSHPGAASTYPTSTRARRIEYRPDPDGDADPGEIVWTWVEYEDDPHRGKDRPVLVVGRDGTHILGLMLSSQHYHRDDPDWMSLGTGSWDGVGAAATHKESFVRLDRILEVPQHGIRREGAVLDRTRFDHVAARLRNDFGWH